MASASRARRATTTGATTASSGESEVFRAWDLATKSQKRTDIKKIMILGAGPIVIGQVRSFACARVRGGDHSGGGRDRRAMMMGDRPVGVVFFFFENVFKLEDVAKDGVGRWRTSRWVPCARGASRDRCARARCE